MEGFFVIAGLGNPGRKYDGSRHNVGFDVIDELVDRYHINNPEHFGKCLMAKGFIEGHKVILMKPLTYMNLSGEAVRQVCDYYRVDVEEQLLVISDDIDLEIGQLRMRKKGSAGGHNGLKNIIQHLGTDAFCRIRIGVGGKPNPDYDLADFVLGHFNKEDREIIEAAEQKAADAAVCMVTDGPDLAMNRYNTPKKKKKKKKEKPAAESGQGSPEQVTPEPVTPEQGTPEQGTPEQGTLEQDNLDHPSEKQDKTV